MKLFTIIVACLVLSISIAYGEILRGIDAHNQYIYPTARVEKGSGTIVYSKENTVKDHADDQECYATYILTNHHVIAHAISIVDEWDSTLGENVKKERRSVVNVEIFKYKDLSTPVGTTKLEADIMVYSKDHDLAVLQLRYEGEIEYIAVLPSNKTHANLYRVTDESVAVGCSLGWPPLISTGIISRMNFQIGDKRFDMSTAQIIFGNSGGGMYDNKGVFIGVPSRVAVYPIGWSGADVAMHMGVFIPARRVYKWLDKEFYNFIYDPTKDRKTLLEERKAEIEKRKKAKR